MSTIVNRSIREFLVTFVVEELIEIYNEDVIPTLKELIMNNYDQKLTPIVFLNNNILNGDKYRSIFLGRLNNFEFIKDVTDTGLTFSCPDMENFDFSGELASLRILLEGTLKQEPIDIMWEAEKYFDDNQEQFQNDAIEMAIKRFKDFHKGIKPTEDSVIKPTEEV